MKSASFGWWSWVCALVLCAPRVFAAPGSTEEPQHQVLQGHAQVRAGVITAGADGAVLALPNGLEVALAPHTVLRRFGEQEVWYESLGKTRSQLFQVDAGRVFATVRVTAGEKPVPAVFHTRHHLTGVCLGGQLALNIGEGASVANLEGSAEVRKGSRWRTLAEGEVLANTKGARRPESRQLLGAPAAPSGRRLWSAFAGTATVSGFRWQAVPGAVGYQVQISDTTERVVAERSTKLSSFDEALQLQPGSYHLSVRALDEFGFPGRQSSALDFRVLGFATPGSHLDARGVARLGSDGALELTAAEGLEMTFGELDRWGPVPELMVIRRPELTWISFRLPGNADVVKLPVQTENLAAEIEFGPERVTWPGAAVKVIVKLRDVAGGRSAEQAEARIETSVGLEPVRLEWRREGNTLSAEVPSRAGSGPWVIRVSVRSASGAELGRNVFEVGSKLSAPRPAPRFRDLTPVRRLASAE
jgi:hypothetical protein